MTSNEQGSDDGPQSGAKAPFAEFWRRYLAAHSKPATRAAHYLATLNGIGATLASIQFGHVGYLIGGIVLSISMAVGSHWLIEGNQPLIRVNAFYGALADLRMCWLALTGGVGREYERLGLQPRKGAEAQSGRSQEPVCPEANSGTNSRRSSTTVAGGTTCRLGRL